MKGNVFQKKYAILFLCIVLAVVVLCAALPLYLSYISQWIYNVELFSYYENDFVCLVDFIEGIALTDDHNISGNALWYGISKDSDSGNLFLYTAQGERIVLENDIQQALMRVMEAFPHKDGKLDMIRYNESGVFFCTHNGIYSLVYTFEDKKPAFVNTADETSGTNVRKITENWYHVVPDRHWIG